MSKPIDSGETLIATNSNAHQNFFIDEVVEAGIVLRGTEIKSIRATAPNLRDSFVDVVGTPGKKLEAYLMNTHIGPYSHGNIWNHEATRKRKLLLHRHRCDDLRGVRRSGNDSCRDHRGADLAGDQKIRAAGRMKLPRVLFF